MMKLGYSPSPPQDVQYITLHSFCGLHTLISPNQVVRFDGQFPLGVEFAPSSDRILCGYPSAAQLN
jgi:hypothetical protein